MSAGTTLGGGDDMQGDRLSVDDWAAAYALDALSPADRARFEAEASPAARLEAEQLADTATLLSGEEVAPPTGLRASILDAIADEPQEAPAPTAHASPAAVAPARDDQEASAPVTSAPVSPAPVSPAPVSPAPGSPRPGPAERRARARWRPARILGAVAAGAALLAGGIAIGTQLGGTSPQEALGAVIAAPDAQRSEVELAGGATATAVWSADLARGVLLLDGLAAPPAGHTYQAWYIDAAGARSAGVFETAGGSTAVLLEGEMDAGVAVGVTVEPEGGSDAPTTEPIAVVQT